MVFSYAISHLFHASLSRTCLAQEPVSRQLSRRSNSAHGAAAPCDPPGGRAPLRGLGPPHGAWVLRPHQHVTLGSRVVPHHCGVPPWVLGKEYLVGEQDTAALSPDRYRQMPDPRWVNIGTTPGGVGPFEAQQNAGHSLVIALCVPRRFRGGVPAPAGASPSSRLRPCLCWVASTVSGGILGPFYW